MWQAAGLSVLQVIIRWQQPSLSGVHLFVVPPFCVEMTKHNILHVDVSRALQSYNSAVPWLVDFVRDFNRTMLPLPHYVELVSGYPS